jgi:hypothetical protein
MNTGLYPETPREPGGPCPFTIRLLLNPAAMWNLTAYSNATGLAAAAAVRAILREVAIPKVGVSGRRGMRLAAPEEVIPVGRLPRFPDSRSLAARKRRGLPAGKPTVCVTCALTVRLDALAYRGLARTAVALGVTHQEAARYLLAEARPPGGPGQGTGGRRPVGSVSGGRPIGSPPD